MEGIKVIELAAVLAGPAVGMFMAELGAEVIKYENGRTGGDMTRRWKLPEEDPNSRVSAYFSSVNYHKKYVMANLADEAERNALYEQVKEADIVITNYKMGDDVKLGVDYETLKAINPRLIYGHISGYGNDDDRVAFDLALQADAGFMYMNGTPESGPIKMPLAMIDMLAAHQLKQGILLQLWQRERTGKGALVTASLYDAAIAALTNQATNWLMAGHIPQAMGSLHPNIAPYGEVLNCGDSKPLVLAVGSDAQFRSLCRELGNEALADKPEYAINQQRVIHREQMLAELQALACQIDRDTLLHRLEKAHVPAAGIHNMQEVFDQPRAKELVLEETIDGVPTKRPASVVFQVFE